MDEDDDLDAELALFETQIQRVKAATKPPDAPSKPSPEPVSTPAPPTPPVTLTPVSTPVQPQLQPSPQAPKPQPQRTHHATAKTPDPSQPAQSTSRWFWDGTAWRWRTAPTAPLATTATPALPAQAPAPVQVPKLASTKRTAAGEVWIDPSLADWPADDHRIFVGDLAPDATEKHMCDAFGVYPSFAMARIVRDKRSGACRGYGFVSFSDGRDMVRALRELNGKYVGGRPVKLKRSNWEKRSLKGEKYKELKALRKISKK